MQLTFSPRRDTLGSKSLPSFQDIQCFRTGDHTGTEARQDKI